MSAIIAKLKRAASLSGNLNRDSASLPRLLVMCGTQVFKTSAGRYSAENPPAQRCESAFKERQLEDIIRDELAHSASLQSGFYLRQHDNDKTVFNNSGNNLKFPISRVNKRCIQTLKSNSFKGISHRIIFLMCRFFSSSTFWLSVVSPK